MSADPILDAWDFLARRRPGEPLVLATERAASVAEVDHAALDCARRVAQVATDGGVVALAADNGPGFLAAFLGLRRAGCVVLLLDARAPVAQRAASAAALGALAFAEVKEAWPRSAGWLELGRIPTASGTTPPGQPHAETAVLRLTSGSTGAPRAVAVSAAALVADDRQLAATLGLRQDERILAAVPLSYAYGFSSIALPALLRGSPIVVPRSGRPWGAFEAARELGATFVPAVPALLDAVARAPRPPRPSSALRLLVSAGAPLSPATAGAVRERWGCAVHGLYGASESGAIAFDRAGGAAERGTVGTPVDGVTIELDAPESTLPGQVTVRSAAVATSYFPYPRPELCAGVYRSADLAVWRDGELELRGRADDVINIKGKKVHPRDVEEVVRGAPGVQDVLVIAAPAPGGGELVRAIVVSDGSGVDPEAVRRYSQARLADFQVPRSVVVVAELPRNARGKVDREAARSLGSLEPAAR